MNARSRLALFALAVTLGASISSLAAQASARAAQKQAPAQAQSPEAHARDVLRAIVAGKFADVEAQYTDQMKAALPAGKLAQSWSALTGQVGNFGQVSGGHSGQQAGYDVVTLACDFEHAKIDAIVSFTATGQLAAIRFLPHQEEAPWTPPSYAVQSAFTEQPITVQFQHWSLPGTLTTPNGAGPFPLVVLLQGSGPQDADETIGPNKVFKDLAWGLASQGVAVLRYTKRTKQYPMKSSDDPNALTVDDEAINDARAAVALAARQPHIDPKQIYVLGHSLGGYLGPRIAKDDPQIAGLIILAGSCRPLEQIVVEQVRNLVGVSHVPQDQADKQIAQAEQEEKAIESPDLKKGDTVHLLGAPIPASYFLDLRNYHPEETAASLSIPIFLIQGGRDFNVNAADYNCWLRRLAGRPNVSTKMYRDLTHVFMPSVSPGEGLGTPADDEHPGHVDPQVVHDISAWILAGGRKTQ